MMRQLSNWIYTIFWLLMLGAAGACLAHGQATAPACTTQAPCAPVTITDSQVPGTTGSTMTLYACMGGSGGCNATTLAAFIASPTTPSQWSQVIFPATKSPLVYNYPVQYGALMNWAASTSLSGGPSGPVSAIVTFQVPEATTAPTVSAGPGLVTSGTSGAQ